MLTVHGIVRGRVQGVCFRDFTRGAADSLGVSGWVRNVPDGTVEFLASGGEDAVRAFMDKVRQGPPASRVEGVDADERPGAEASGGFEVRR
ncbi:acylphosphatase [Desulfohalovibrio reitneri]|uniref:acylphosphatase n=1 Tax=Desulfohalovibrio reitneri TaxID=1307759 RepID=UPI0004A76C68|nr:acylphosphatase [Desulfohalovibrio reitneri]